MSTKTEPLLMPLDSDPTKGDRARPVARAILRVVIADDVAAATVGRYRLEGGKEHFIECYIDEIDEIKADVRTAQMREDMRLAHRLADEKMRAHVAAGLDGFRGTQVERERLEDKLRKTAAIHWAVELRALGYKHGLPALVECEKVADKEMPVSQETAHLAANAHLVDLVKTIVDQIRGAQSSQPQQQNRKG